VILQSQLAEEYGLAKLGLLGDQIERLGKYDRPDKPLNRLLAQKAIDYYLEWIPQEVPCTFEEAVENLNFSASTGFGAKNAGIKTREDPKLLDYLRSYLQHSPISVVINASQKDEVRSTKKTPRLFMSYPVEHTFASSLILSRLVSTLYTKTYATCGFASAIGDAPQRGSFVEYRRRLLKHPYFYATDTKSQDSTVTRDFINMVYDKLREKLILDPVQECIFDGLRLNSIHKTVNLAGTFYSVDTGLGSGDYLTSIINMIWRMYMFYCSYNHDISTVHEDNEIIILGDDFVCSSKYDDLNMDSEYATIVWAGRPIPMEDLDFCSLKFLPFVHHDPEKVLSVFKLRKNRQHSMSYRMQLVRMAGLLRCCTEKYVYDIILDHMHKCSERWKVDISDLIIPYDEVFSNYNFYTIFHSRTVRNPKGAVFKMDNKNATKKNRNRRNRNREIDKIRRDERKLMRELDKVDNPLGVQPERQVHMRERVNVIEGKFETLAPLIKSSIGYNCPSFVLNPFVLPWGGPISRQFTYYRFTKVKWIYTPKISQLNPNGQQGTIVLSWNQNVTDESPNNITDAMQFKPSKTGMAYQKLEMELPKKLLGRRRFVRDRSYYPPRSDPTRYDVGRLFICTEGMADTGTEIGYIGIEYTIHLSVPKVDTGLNYGPPNLSFVRMPMAIDQAWTNNNPLSITFTELTGYRPNFGIVPPGPQILVPPGNWLINFFCVVDTGSAGTITTADILVRKNGTILPEARWQYAHSTTSNGPTRLTPFLSRTTTTNDQDIMVFELVAADTLAGGFLRYGYVEFISL